ncbi:uncharacterized protein BDZ99DRAFT_497657 [Mytilinidion resinicola]|uniref:Uncharacterized protein n=1 Tax=Mytilinidion resinicola TaxID=574789 RepID=A0A6A6YQ45_9PEZI|nr:uncharacterized protein BDZ99DRAFT_497657 [Mytilinidion resinicola]KAF2810658.1 hypothetical protein BDZ99DRAFT_497657 [Mytilinidion resinicola]
MSNRQTRVSDRTPASTAEPTAIPLVDSAVASAVALEAITTVPLVSLPAKRKRVKTARALASLFPSPTPPPPPIAITCRSKALKWSDNIVIAMYNGLLKGVNMGLRAQSGYYSRCWQIAIKRV